MNTYIRLINKDGGKIYDNLPIDLEEYYTACKNFNEVIESKNKSNQKMRHGISITEFGTVYIISDDKEIVSRPRYFKEKLNVYAEHLQEINSIKDDLRQFIQSDNRRLVHNITSINAHIIQEIYLLVPEEKLSTNYREILEIIKDYLIKDTDAAASAFLRIAKNSIAMKSEFTVFKKLSGEKPILQKQTHDVRKVLLTVLHVFFQDFKELDVLVQIGDKGKFLMLDFETIRVALYHFIDNTTKFILPDTDFRIKFQEEETKFTITFDMISMEIKSDELENIFKDGVSGANAKQTKKDGDGLGMSIICNILKLHDAQIIIHPNQQPPISRRLNGVNYVRNIFDMVFEN